MIKKYGDLHVSNCFIVSSNYIHVQELLIVGSAYLPLLKSSSFMLTYRDNRRIYFYFYFSPHFSFKEKKKNLNCIHACVCMALVKRILDFIVWFFLFFNFSLHMHWLSWILQLYVENSYIIFSSLSSIFPSN